MTRIALLLACALLFGCGGSGDSGPRCEQVCRKFVNVCGWPAWTSVEQCKRGCLEDMYRRSDANEVLDCYAAAADPPTTEAVNAAVDEAVARGVYDSGISQGTFDRAAALSQMTEQMTCDPFAAVQCKTDAVLVRPDLPLVNEDSVGSSSPD